MLPNMTYCAVVGIIFDEVGKTRHGAQSVA